MIRFICSECYTDNTPRGSRFFPTHCGHCREGGELHTYNLKEQEDLNQTYTEETFDTDTLNTLDDWTRTYLMFLGGVNVHTVGPTKGVEVLQRSIET